MAGVYKRSQTSINQGHEVKDKTSEDSNQEQERELEQGRGTCGVEKKTEVTEIKDKENTRACAPD